MRVANLNYINNNVSMQPAGSDEWSPAVVNRPFTTGDYLWADADSSAELHLNNGIIRLAPQSSLGFLNLDDRFAQLRFSQGELVLIVWRLGDNESFEVDTPNAAITILREGEYRFNADPDSATTWTMVRRGEAEVTGGGQAFTLRPGNSAQLIGTDQLSYNVQYAPDPDWFERWSTARDADFARAESAHYLPPDVIGYEELEHHGHWRDTPGYGSVWYPTVDASWAPYHDGHWAWVEPWGWTWVDDAPWGFAPSHYGRWAYVSGGWGWVPGPMIISGGGAPAMRPMYAPALVAFIGGGSFGASISAGGPAIGWVPLGPGEVYAPAYQVSQNYFRTVNVSSTTVVNTVNITNVYNNVYVNKTVTNVTVNQHFANMAAPNAVNAMPQNAFASGRPVRQAGVVVTRNQVAQVQPASMTVAPAVAPVKQALAPMAGSRPAMRPPARAVSMPVVAKVAPPPAPVPFAAKQAAFQQNLGRPVNIPVIRQAAAPRTPVASPAVRVAAPARQVVPQVQPVKAAAPPKAPGPPPGQTNFRPPVEPAPAAQPVNRAPVQPTPSAQPVNRPPQPAPTPQPGYRPPVQTPPSNPRPAETNPRPAETNPRPVQPPPQAPRATQPPPPAPRVTQPPPESPRATQPPPQAPRATQPPPQAPRATQPPPESPRATQPPPRAPRATQPPPTQPQPRVQPGQGQKTTQRPPEKKKTDEKKEQ